MPKPQEDGTSASSAGRWILCALPIARPKAARSSRCNPRAATATRSRIVARLTDGVVTTPRAEADLVVTEHGLAELRGRTLAERAHALTQIADPAFRAGLATASEQLV